MSQLLEEVNDIKEALSVCAGRQPIEDAERVGAIRALKHVIEIQLDELTGE